MKWEYKIVEMGYSRVTEENEAAVLNTLGNDGWEMVYIYNARAYFKREVKGWARR